MIQCVSNVFPIQSRDCPFKVEIFHVSSTISPIPSWDVPRFPKVSPTKSSKIICQQPAASSFFVPSVWIQNQSASNDPSPARGSHWRWWWGWWQWKSRDGCHENATITCQKSYKIMKYHGKTMRKTPRNTMKCDETYHQQNWIHLKSTAHELMMVMLHRGAPSALGDCHISGKDGENHKAGLVKTQQPNIKG